MAQAICDCGETAVEGGYCKSCAEKIRIQIEKEIQADEIAMKSDYHEQLQDIADNPEPRRSIYDRLN